MKRIAIVIIAILLCLAVLIVWVLAGTNITINSFNLTGYSSPVGVGWNNAFVLNYTNNGLTDVHNVTVTFTTDSPYQIKREIAVFDSASPYNYVEDILMDEPYSLGDIKAGETKEFRGEVWNTVADGSKMGGFAFIATLKSNGLVLDQATVYPSRFENPSYDITCTYHKISSEVDDNDTRFVLLVTANYNKSYQATLSYNEFSLNTIYTENGTGYPVIKSDNVAPVEVRNFSLGNENRNFVFELTFQFPTTYNGHTVSSYSLGYSDHKEGFSIEFIHEDLLDKDS